MELDNKELI